MKSFSPYIDIIYSKIDFQAGFVFISGIGAAIVLNVAPIIRITDQSMCIIPTNYIVNQPIISNIFIVLADKLHIQLL